MRSYRVRCELDETGWYAVTIPDVPGCITQARSVPQAVELVREALALLVGDEAAEEEEQEPRPCPRAFLGDAVSQVETSKLGR